MRLGRVLRQRLRSLFKPSGVENDLQQELALHLEQLTNEYKAQGLPEHEARMAARRAFGGVAATAEQCRDTRRLRFLEDIGRDLAYAFRLLARSPGFTATAVLSLALGIGANTAIFSAIDALMLRSLPVRNPEQLVMLTKAVPNDSLLTFPFREFDRYRGLTQVFSDMLAVTPVDRSGISLDGRGSDDAQVRVGVVSGSYFSTMGVSARLGRTLTPDDDRGIGGHPVAVISHGYWQRKFALDPGVVGKEFVLNGTRYTILGVTPPDFTGDWVGRPFDMWVPVAMLFQVMPEIPAGERGSLLNYRFIARLRPGVTPAQAQAAGQVLLQQILAEAPGPRNPTEVKLRVDSAARGFSPQRESFAQPLAILMAMVAALLLIACANVANLLLARAAARRQEIAVRLAIGAGRARIVRQLLVENLLLAFVGGTLGLLFAVWGAGALAGFVRSGPVGGLLGLASIDLDLRLDARILAFDVALCLFTGIFFGLLPAWRSSRVSLSPGLSRRGADLGGPGGKLALRNLLVVSQVALSLMMLAGMGLFLRSLHNLRSESLGIDRERLLLVWTQPGQTGRSPAALAALFETVQKRIAALPGVISASPSVYGVLGYSTGGDGPSVTADGYTLKPDEVPRAYFHIVGPGFFHTAGIKLLEGREFNERDDAGAPKRAIINETMARYFFGQSSPLGRHVRVSFGNNPPLEVVGVAADAKSSSPRERNHMAFYYPVRQQVGMRLIRMCLVVRAAGPPASIAAGVRGEIRQIDPRLPVLKIDTVDEQVEDVLFQERLVADLSLCFGVAAILLACLGLYGVMSYTVARRTNEIGIRMALGARRSDVLGMVARESLLLVLAGIACGIPAALAAAPVIENRLFRVGPSDPLTIGGAAVLMIAVAAVAGMLPARKASKVDPLVALRYE
jgi:predicted permease